MSDFARKQLEKYGWSEGKGLGKKEDGITKPIKASMKFDTQGIGHNNFDILTSMWWYDAFNQAASRIKVTKTETGVSVKCDKPEVKTTKQPSLKYTNKGFVKAGEQEEDENGTLTGTTNTLIPSLSKSSNYENSGWNYERLKKPKSSLKMKHIRVMEQDALYAKKKKKKETSANR